MEKKKIVIFLIPEDCKVGTNLEGEGKLNG